MRTYPNLQLPGNLRTVFLDRDGVINEKMPEGEYVLDCKNLRILPGVEEAIGRLNAAGIRVLVVSNQHGIARGLHSVADVNSIHDSLQCSLMEAGAHVDGFYFCPHSANECDCRKPLPGLFKKAVDEFPATTAKTSVMIGDSLSDIEFARRLGMATILIEGDKRRRNANWDEASKLADLICTSLPTAVSALLSNELVMSTP